MKEIGNTGLNKSYVTTVPSGVRMALSLVPGDRISWCVGGDEIVVRKGKPKPSDEETQKDEPGS